MLTVLGLNYDDQLVYTWYLTNSTSNTGSWSRSVTVSGAAPANQFVQYRIMEFHDSVFITSSERVSNYFLRYSLLSSLT